MKNYVKLKSYASRESLKEYSRYRRLGLPLKCPCNYSSGSEILHIEKFLTSDLLLLRSTKNPGNLTLAVKEDLVFVSKEE